MKSPIRGLHVLGSLDCSEAETMVMNIYRTIDRIKDTRGVYSFLVKRLSLDHSANSWAETILEIKEINCKEAHRNIINVGYGIKSAVL